MRLGGDARYLCEVTTEAEAKEASDWARTHNLPLIMIGEGSNIVWRDEGFPGLVAVNRIPGRDVLHEDDQSVLIRIGGGENWDKVVARTVENGWSGIEFLSLIPGTAGAAPVQNIGAYGAELSTVLKEIRAYDTQENDFKTLLAADCGFGYRSSRFKNADKGRFLITSMTLELKKSAPAPPFYESLQNYLDENQISSFDVQTIRSAVIAIRSSKLPDPTKVANNGSFFTNPIITTTRFEELKQKYPDIKGWPINGGKVKLAAGWLVEKAGFKGVRDEATGMATWPAQALVLVNESARSTADLLEFRQKIIFKVDETFGVVLEQEPELLP